MGRLFNMDSTSQTNVWSVSLVNKQSRVIAFKVFYTDFISASQAPPIHGLLGGLNVQIKLTCFLTNSDATLGILISVMAPWSSFCASLKFVPLSDQMCLTFPQQVIKQCNAKMKASVARSSAISKCMARAGKYNSISFSFCLVCSGFLWQFYYYWAKKVNTSIIKRFLISV